MPTWAIAGLAAIHFFGWLASYDYFEKNFFPETTFMHGETGSGRATIAAFFWEISFLLLGIAYLICRLILGPDKCNTGTQSPVSKN